MNILHITASPLIPQSGITAVLKGLTINLNKIENIQARVLSLSYPIDKLGCEYFDELRNKTFNEYVDDFKPDLAIFHSFYQLEFVKPARVLHRKHIPFFLEPHGSFGTSALKKSSLKKIICDHTIFRNLIKNAEAYIFTNKAELLDSKYHNPREMVIPNGVEKNIVLNASKKNELGDTLPILYFLGRFDAHHKGLDYLFDALHILDDKHKNIEVRLFGTGSLEQIEYVNSSIKNFKHVKVLNMGTIFGEDKKRELEKAHILILTSRYEGSPMTILDAWCYGNPCILTPGTNVSDEACQNHIGWKTPLAADKIADTILQAINEYKASPEKFEIACKEYVLNKYVWDEIARTAALEYKRIINI